jgi:toxin ParE1/3/4
VRLRFHPAAQQELEAAAMYYEEANAGLGQRFLQAVRAATARLLEYPELGAPGVAGTRRLQVHGFPFTVVHQVHPQEITIVAIAHQRRRPGYWRGR